MSAESTTALDKEDRQLFEQLHEDAVQEGNRDVQKICEAVLQSAEFNEETRS